jgi:hypothetical protein
VSPAGRTSALCEWLESAVRAGASQGESSRPLCRLHIVGGAGSGKTTLARHLTRRLRLPVYALDEINFVDGVSSKRPQGERLAAVRQIAAQPAWITEGIFVGWTDELLRQAELIIWLDLPWYTALPRIVRRYLQDSRRGTNRYSGLGTLLKFLAWSWAYYRPMTAAQIDALPEEDLHSRVATARHLGPYREKLIRLRSPDAVRSIW